MQDETIVGLIGVVTGCFALFFSQGKREVIKGNLIQKMHLESL